MSEQQFEKCSLQEATHAESVTGEVYLISKSENRLRIVVEGYSIFNETWKALGIKSLKEKKREPIEFEAIVKQDMPFAYLSNVPDGIPLGTKFKCVEILEDGE